MDEQKERERQAARVSREARDRRILQPAREGSSCDETARAGGSSAERVRQIVDNLREGKSREAFRAALHARL